MLKTDFLKCRILSLLLPLMAIWLSPIVGLFAELELWAWRLEEVIIWPWFDVMFFVSFRWLTEFSCITSVKFLCSWSVFCLSLHTALSSKDHVGFWFSFKPAFSSNGLLYVSSTPSWSLPSDEPSSFCVCSLTVSIVQSAEADFWFWCQLLMIQFWLANDSVCTSLSPITLSWFCSLPVFFGNFKF